MSVAKIIEKMAVTAPGKLHEFIARTMMTVSQFFGSRDGTDRTSQMSRIVIHPGVDTDFMQYGTPCM
jgi:hypothetical protein